MKIQTWLKPLRYTAMALLLGLTVLAVGCSDDDDPTDPKVDPLQEKLQTLLNDKIRQYNSPGAVMAVQLPGKDVWTFASGYADKDAKIKMEPDHRVRIGSITKTFCALTVMQMVQEDLIDLDDTVEEWLPGMVDPLYRPDQITVRNLLNHTSGIQNYIPHPNLIAPLLLDPSVSWTPDQLIAYANEAGQLFGPTTPTIGDTWSYSNTNYILLGLIAEKASHSSWEIEVTRRFIEPLDMTGTYVPGARNPYILGKHANGYYNFFDVLGEPFPDSLVEHTLSEPSATWASGNMVSTMEDLVTWITAIKHGRLLQGVYQSYLFDYFDALVIDGQVVGRMGLGLVQEPDEDIVGHRGQIPGFDCTMQYQETDNFAIAACFNRSTESNMNVMLIYDAVEMITNELNKSGATAKLRETVALPNDTNPKTRGVLSEYK